MSLLVFASAGMFVGSLSGAAALGGDVAADVIGDSAADMDVGGEAGELNVSDDFDPSSVPGAQGINPDAGITVLGRSSDAYNTFAANNGLNALDLPPADYNALKDAGLWDEVNKFFIDQALRRGDSFWFVTVPDLSQLGPCSFRNEVEWLIDALGEGADLGPYIPPMPR